MMLFQNSMVAYYIDLPLGAIDCRVFVFPHVSNFILACIQ